MGRLTSTGIRDLLDVVGRPDVISFAGGTPDSALLPLARLRSAYARVLADTATAGIALQYSSSQGWLPLRERLAQMMTGEGVSCGPEHIAITAGSQQALDLLGKLFVSPGDRVAVARPTYLGALQALSMYEPCFCEIEPHADSAPPALIYVVPDSANPTGTSLNAKERRDLVSAARRWDAVLVEDAAYRSLGFEGPREASLLALDIKDSGSIERVRTAYCGTLSKTLAPGLRLGWICGPRWLVDQIALLQQGADLHPSTINQMVAHACLEEDFETHLENLRAAYALRAQAMETALVDSMPPSVGWSRPDGGFFIWLTLPGELDGAHLLRRSLSEAGVAFVPGGAFYGERPEPATARLSYSMASASQITEGVGRLGELVRRELR